MVFPVKVLIGQSGKDVQVKPVLFLRCLAPEFCCTQHHPQRQRTPDQASLFSGFLIFGSFPEIKV
jgi:hypothetical protein